MKTEPKGLLINCRWGIRERERSENDSYGFVLSNKKNRVADY